MTRGKLPLGRISPEDEIQDELDAHFEGTVSLLVGRGLSEAEARAEARRRFGDLKLHRDRLEGMARRRARRRSVRRWVTVARATIAQGVRSLRTSMGTSCAVVGTLLLGIGVNGAVFRVVDQLLLSPPPHVEEPSRVVRLHQTVRQGTNEPRTTGGFSYLDINALRTPGADHRISGALLSVPETFGEGQGAVRARVARVDAEYFPLLGVEAVVGRGLVEADHAPGAGPVAVLRHSFWRTRFGSDPSVIGRIVRVSDGRYQVVGVMPAGFFGAQAPAVDVWIPLEPEAAKMWGEGWRHDLRHLGFRVVARLPDGIGRETWRLRQEDALARARAEAGGPFQFLGLAVSSLVPGNAPETRPVVAVSRWLGGISILVLIVACANAANLFIAEAERRRRLTAVRMALGAGAWRLRAELIVRTALLAAIGAAGAAILALWGGTMLQDLFLASLELPPRQEATRMILVVGGLALVATFLVGVIPALRHSDGDVRSALEAGGRSTRGSTSVRKTLVVVQVGLSMVLLIGAGLFIRSFRGALDVDLGFDANRLIVVSLEREGEGAAGAGDLYGLAKERVLSRSEVVSASATVAVPFQLLYALSAGRPDGEVGTGAVSVNAVGADYFATTGIPIHRGRPIEEDDLLPGAEPVAVVGRRAAERLWSGGDPLGSCLRVGDEGGVCTRVVGVAEEHTGVSWTDMLMDPSLMQAWVPLGHPAGMAPAALLVRVRGDASRAIDEVRRAAMVPGTRYVEAEPLRSFVAREMRSWRLGATVFSILALVALLVALLGLYAVLSFEVAQRRREFGIRRALGGGRLRVMVPAIRSALPMVVAGIGLGSLLAAIGAQRLEPLLFRTSPWEPSVFAATAAMLMVAAVASLVIPAWRASSVDPREVLVEE